MPHYSTSLNPDSYPIPKLKNYLLTTSEPTRSHNQFVRICTSDKNVANSYEFV